MASKHLSKVAQEIWEKYAHYGAVGIVHEAYPEALAAIERLDKELARALNAPAPCKGHHEWSETPVCLICGVEWKDAQKS